MPLPNLLAMLGLFVWLAFEVILRRRDDIETTSWAGSPSDRGSTLLLIVSFVVAIVLTLVLLFADIGRVPESVRWIGVAMEAIGLVLRAWGMRVLGRYYTRTVRTVAEQTLVTDGPYRWLRHPGYTGSLLVWTGYCLGLGDWVALVLVGGLLLAAYAWRIQAEEKMMIETFGDDYVKYRRRTARLIPPLY